MGVAHSTVFFWLSGKTENISGKLWQSRIRPVLAPFMLKAQQGNPGSHPVIYRDISDYQKPDALILGESGVFPQQDPFAKNSTYEDVVTVVPWNTLYQLDPGTETIPQFRKRNKIGESVFFRQIRRDYFGVKLEKDYGNFLMAGTTLLIAPGESLIDGDVLIVRLHDEKEIILCRFYRNGNDVLLKPLIPEGKEFRWDCTQNIGYMIWAYPVFEAKMEFRDPADD